jgi:hypothetical protein
LIFPDGQTNGKKPRVKTPVHVKNSNDKTLLKKDYYYSKKRPNRKLCNKRQATSDRIENFATLDRIENFAKTVQKKGSI